MKQKNIRILFLIAFPVLFLQFALSLGGLQTYPGIVFPEFGYAGKEVGRFQYDKPEFTAFTQNGDSIHVDEFEMFGNLPLSFLPTVLKKKFRYENSYENKVEFGQGHQFRLHSYLYEFRRIPPTYSDKDYNDFKNFMKNKLVALTGRQDLARMNVKWFRCNHFHHDDRDDIETELEHQFDLVFN